MKPALVFGTSVIAILFNACNPNPAPNPNADAGPSSGTGIGSLQEPTLPTPSSAGGSNPQSGDLAKDASVERSNGKAGDASIQTVNDSGGGTGSDDLEPVTSQDTSVATTIGELPGADPVNTAVASATSNGATGTDVPARATSSASASATSIDVPTGVTSSPAATATSTDVPGVDTANTVSSSSDSTPSAATTDTPVIPDPDAGVDAGTVQDEEPATSAVSATSTPSETLTAVVTDAPSATATPSATAVASASSSGPSLDPRQLFNDEAFGGNGRTCLTCHGAVTGTFSPADAQALYNTDPNAPLFRPIDSDDGVGSDYSRLLKHATVRVGIALPVGVTLTANPSATSVVFNRSTPTTLNTPALDSVLMWDGRAPDLMAQALDAIDGHAQATVHPTATQLDLIAEFEQGEAFFSSPALRQYSQGGPAPTLPAGNTAAERSGRRFFVNSAFGVCGQCHGGPMLNTTTFFSGLGVGTRFQTVSVSEFNSQGNPVYGFSFPDPKNPGQTLTVNTPDPGRALITGKFTDVNKFKIPTLWGITKTAPYFHDNSADTLEALMDHYQKFLATFRPISDLDKADILAYLKLL